MINRLKDTLDPKSYSLSLTINSDDLTFTGSVNINAQVVTPSDVLVLHAKDLTIQSATVNGQEASTSTQKQADELHIKLTSAVAGEASISIDFSGTITDAMHGMYPCYFKHNGKKKKLIATQFESHHAREVFPCIDEPAAKATFDVELVTKQGEQVLSNMPIKKQVTEDNLAITQFETTPIMSTYLLAFVTGEMIYKESKTKSGVAVRSWAAAHHKLDWLDYSLSESVALIDFFEEYFGVPYPLSKCDQVALPDFESGAMENWGLVTYRETVFLSDPDNPSLTTMQWVSLVVAHELSHQWFGNLVTMEWWDDLWLNESFANMIEYLAVDKLHPEWNIWEEFVASDVLAATNRDLYGDVQAVRVDVHNPAEVSTLFDPSIVYAKGGKLLRTLMLLIGEDSWRKGLEHYFKTHAYKNTKRDDLWQSLSKYTDIDVPALMNTWIEKPGQPLVSVKQLGNKVHLEQQRITLDDTDDDTLWQVPLLADNLPPLLTDKAVDLTLSSETKVQLNLLGVGHYITNYTETDHKEHTLSLLANSQTPSSWKITRLNELVVLARHGDTNLTEALSAITTCKNEERAMVWSLIASVLGNARMLTDGDVACERTIKQLTKNIAQTAFTKTGWDYSVHDNSNTTHLRSILLGLMIASEDDDVVKHALDIYRSTSDIEDLNAEYRSLVLSAVAKFGTDQEYSELLDKHEHTQNPDYRSDLCAALTSTRNVDHIKILHKRMLDTSIVKPQDLRQWFVYLLRNRYAKEATWQWLVTNWSWIMENFSGSKSYDDFARYSASFMSTKQQLEAYLKFFDDKKHDPALKRAITIGSEEIKARVTWRGRDENAVKDWLTKYSVKN